MVNRFHVRPDRNEILNTYSMEELLQLLQEKSKMNSRQLVERIIEQMQSLNEDVPVPKTPLRVPGSPPAKKALPPEEELPDFEDELEDGEEDDEDDMVQGHILKQSESNATDPPAAKKGNGRMSLIDHILAVLPHEGSLGVDQIKERVLVNGYKTSSTDIKPMLYTQLGKLCKLNAIRKVSLGQYQINVQ